MTEPSRQVWKLLQESGIVQGEPPENRASDSPWYVKVLLAFSGWLAAIFILGFIGAAFESVIRNSGVAGMVGVLMIVGAFALLRLPANEFLEHLGLAASMAGQALIVYAIFDFFGHNEILAWFLSAILQAVLVLVMPNFVHRVFSTLVASIALAMAFYEMNILEVAGGVLMFGAALCWLNEFRYPQQMTKIRSVGYGLVLALIALKGTILFRDSTFGERFLKNHGFWTQPWIGEIIIGAVTIYVVWRILHGYGQSMRSRPSMAALLAISLVCAVSIHIQGITVGIIIVCLGFLGSNRVLIGLGIISLLSYISTYYYLLDTTLLDKSQSLLVVGLVLLFVRWLMQKSIPPPNEA